MPARTVLMLGRTSLVLDEVRAALDPSIEVELFTGTSLEDVVLAFSDHAIDAVIIGAGLNLDARLEIVRHIFTVSDTTTVHMKDRGSGPGGGMAFANGVLTGLATKS